MPNKYFGGYHLEHINVWILLIVSVASTLIYGTLRNIFSKKHGTSDSELYLFNAVSSILPLAVFLPSALLGPIVSVYTLLLGVLFGIITAVAAILTLAALRAGPMSYTYLIITLSCVVPALSEMAFWDEDISVGGWLGIILMAASFVLLTEKKGSQNKAGGRWMVLCFAAFAITGLIGVLQKVHQSSSHKLESGAFLIVAFVVSAVSSLCMYFILRGRDKSKNNNAGMSAAGWGMAALCGLFIAAGNQINLFLAGAMDSAVFFPIVNGGGVVLSTATAIILFHERMPWKRVFGLVTGIVSVLLVSGLFG